MRSGGVVKSRKKERKKRQSFVLFQFARLSSFVSDLLRKFSLQSSRKSGTDPLSWDFRHDTPSRPTPRGGGPMTLSV